MLRFTRPLHVFLAALTYLFGASLADYLGRPFVASSYWLGLFIAVLAQATMNFLAEVFRLDVEPLLENETRSARQILRNQILYTALAFIVIIALACYTLFANGLLPLSSFLFLLVSIVVIVTYAIPPLRFVNRGGGEFLLSVQLAYLLPCFAFTLQAGETHRFLAQTLPLTFLALAYFVAADFQTFAQDQKLHRVSFLVRLGWERVVPLHHVFILLAYLLFLVSPAFGLSLSLIWSVFLTFPFALFQIYQLRSIALGAKPNWTLLHATSLGVFGLTTYLLTVTLWLR